MLHIVRRSVLLAISGWLFAGSVIASGSIGTGAGKVSARAAYSLGKALTFYQMVCNNCPILKDELTRERAQSLSSSLEAVQKGGEAHAGDEEAVQALCDDSTADDKECAVRMELVRYFLSRRYR